MPETPDIQDIQAAKTARYLRKSKTPCVLTGAGISADSGIPTFRDAQVGLWEQFRPEELATPAAFRRDPARVHRFYEHRRRLAHTCAPNAAHRGLARLATLLPSLTLITQNVDDLHEQAGSSDVIHLHGHLNFDRCSEGCEGRIPWRIETASDELSTCGNCGAYLRPDVVWFDELLPENEMARATYAARHADLVLVIGTSSHVYPAAELPVIARREGAFVIEINPEPTELSFSADLCVRQRAALFFESLMRHFEAPGPDPSE